MNMVEHELKIAGKFAGRLPIEIARDFLQVVEPALRSAIYMAIQGSGKSIGRPPTWAQAIGDIALRKVHTNGVACFHFDAPTLGEAAPELYHQPDFWRSMPPQNATAFDLLAVAIDELHKGNLDSDCLDDAVLGRVASFGRLFKHGVHGIEMTGGNLRREISRIDNQILENAGKFVKTTPRPQAIRVVGTLDMIRNSTRAFGLLLQDGSSIAGVYQPGDMTHLQPLFRMQVTVNGRMIFRPSGRLLRIDADRVVLGDDESTLWKHLPDASAPRLQMRQIRQIQGPRSGVSAIIGKWPGDESEEEITAALEELS